MCLVCAIRLQDTINWSKTKQTVLTIALANNKHVNRLQCLVVLCSFSLNCFLSTWQTFHLTELNPEKNNWNCTLEIRSPHEKMTEKIKKMYFIFNLRIKIYKLKLSIFECHLFITKYFILLLFLAILKINLLLFWVLFCFVNIIKGWHTK